MRGVIYTFVFHVVVGNTFMTTLESCLRRQYYLRMVHGIILILSILVRLVFFIFW